jgi:hypothetical protein
VEELNQRLYEIVLFRNGETCAMLFVIKFFGAWRSLVARLPWAQEVIQDFLKIKLMAQMVIKGRRPELTSWSRTKRSRGLALNSPHGPFDRQANGITVFVLARRMCDEKIGQV